jgi:hypothetical protein
MNKTKNQGGVNVGPTRPFFQICFASSKTVTYSVVVATAGRASGENRKNGVEHAPPAFMPESRCDRLSDKAVGLDAPGIVINKGADSGSRVAHPSSGGFFCFCIWGENGWGHPKGPRVPRAHEVGKGDTGGLIEFTSVIG